LSGRITKPRDNNVNQTICPGHEIFKHLSFATAPFFLPNPNPQLSPRGEFDPIKDLDDGISGQEELPIPREFPPEAF
jgi:hypothetical protein